jgi:hypothetical protein
MHCYVAAANGYVNRLQCFDIRALPLLSSISMFILHMLLLSKTEPVACNLEICCWLLSHVETACPEVLCEFTTLLVAVVLGYVTCSNPHSNCRCVTGSS